MGTWRGSLLSSHKWLTQVPLNVLYWWYLVLLADIQSYVRYAPRCLHDLTNSYYYPPTDKNYPTSSFGEPPPLSFRLWISYFDVSSPLLIRFDSLVPGFHSLETWDTPWPQDGPPLPFHPSLVRVVRKTRSDPSNPNNISGPHFNGHPSPLVQ